MDRKWHHLAATYDGKQISWYADGKLVGSKEVVLNTNSLVQIGKRADNNEYFMVSDGFRSNEYLLIENRQNAGFDCTLPQGGLAIWHVDDEAGFNTEGYPGQKRWPRNGRHYRVALARAKHYVNLIYGPFIRRRVAGTAPQL